VETIDISLVDDVPKVLDVLRAIRSNFVAGRAFMAEEFRAATGKRPAWSSSGRWRGFRSCLSRTSGSRSGFRKPSA